MTIAIRRMRTLAASTTVSLLTCAAAAYAQTTDPSSYTVHNLVSNGVVPADFTDPNMGNSWGIAFNPQGPVWVNNNATGLVTIFDGNGVAQSLVVTIPGVNGATGNPTGIVFSGGADFVIRSGSASAPAVFLFATESGTIAGWSPQVNATNAITAIDNSASGAVYKGLALSGNGTTHLIYAANFGNSRVDVFDGTFTAVTTAGGFTDPTLPSGFAPFGIQAINGDIYVSYALKAPTGIDEVDGPGLGFVNVFDPEGRLIRRVASQGALNAPWGMTVAPASFGDFGETLLVGNFGDGTINAFDLRTGASLGTLRDSAGNQIVIDGLWGMAFGNGIMSQPTTTLFFAGGPVDETGGVFGRVTLNATTTTGMSTKPSGSKQSR
jgi:uncharacterized protein (TIGR03118 family)